MHITICHQVIILIFDLDMKFLNPANSLLRCKYYELDTLDYLKDVGCGIMVLGGYFLKIKKHRGWNKRKY